jgi:CubicO group peptidase (beta-lactamase class C family)
VGEDGVITALVEGGRTNLSDDATAVPLWSFTKTILAAAALALVSEKKLALDEPVGDRSFTPRPLLQHTSGLPDYGTLAAYHAAVARGDTKWPVDRLLDAAGARTLLFPPGQGWAYSNIGYLILGRVIEDASGVDLETALVKRVFEPLGVGGVRFARTLVDLASTAWGNALGYDPGWVYHGLLVGSTRAAALLLHGLLAGGLFDGPLPKAMTTPRPLCGPVPGRPWRTAGYGLGLMIGVGASGTTVLGHGGAGPGSTAAVFQAEPCRTAAVFAPLDDPATVERRAMAMAEGRGDLP